MFVGKGGQFELLAHLSSCLPASKPPSYASSSSMCNCSSYTPRPPLLCVTAPPLLCVTAPPTLDAMLYQRTSNCMFFFETNICMALNNV